MRWPARVHRRTAHTAGSESQGCGRRLLGEIATIVTPETLYVTHHHAERNHQGVGNRLLKPLATVSSIEEPDHCRERLGGLLNYYYRKAA